MSRSSRGMFEGLSMLLRVLRHRLRDAIVEDFEADLRHEGIARIRAHPGVLAAHVGRDAAGSYLVMSAWASFDDLSAAAGPDILRPLVGDRWDAEIADVTVTHWETLDLPTIGSPGEPRILRVVTGSVRPNAEASYFEYVRTRGWATLGAVDGIVGAWAGRRTDGRTDRFLALTAWRDRTAIEAMGALDRPIVDDATIELLTVNDVEHFTVIPADAPDPDDPPTIAASRSG